MVAGSVKIGVNSFKKKATPIGIALLFYLVGLSEEGCRWVAFFCQCPLDIAKISTFENFFPCGSA